MTTNINPFQPYRAVMFDQHNAVCGVLYASTLVDLMSQLNSAFWVHVEASLWDADRSMYRPLD